MTKVLAAEFGATGIRANAILPGGTDTPANHANLPDAPEGTRAFIESLHALKRLGQPEEIAQSALHLASDASSFITGAALLFDGGVSINRTYARMRARRANALAGPFVQNKIRFESSKRSFSSAGGA